MTEEENHLLKYMRGIAPKEVLDAQFSNAILFGFEAYDINNPERIVTAEEFFGLTYPMSDIEVFTKYHSPREILEKLVL